MTLELFGFIVLFLLILFVGKLESDIKKLKKCIKSLEEATGVVPDFYTTL